jgi:hypothetical protein
LAIALAFPIEGEGGNLLFLHPFTALRGRGEGVGTLCCAPKMNWWIMALKTYIRHSRYTTGVNNTGVHIFSEICIDRGDIGNKFSARFNEFGGQQSQQYQIACTLNCTPSKKSIFKCGLLPNSKPNTKNLLFKHFSHLKSDL